VFQYVKINVELEAMPTSIFLNNDDDDDEYSNRLRKRINSTCESNSNCKSDSTRSQYFRRPSCSCLIFYECFVYRIIDFVLFNGIIC